MTAAELQEAQRLTAIGETFDEHYGIGVLAALHAVARERYPDDPDRRAAWLEQIISRGEVVIDLDGIWHVDGSRAARISCTEEYE